jgi:hypothetical protein
MEIKLWSTELLSMRWTYIQRAYERSYSANTASRYPPISKISSSANHAESWTICDTQATLSGPMVSKLAVILVLRIVRCVTCVTVTMVGPVVVARSVVTTAGPGPSTGAAMATVMIKKKGVKVSSSANSAGRRRWRVNQRSIGGIVDNGVSEGEGVELLRIRRYS